MILVSTGAPLVLWSVVGAIIAGVAAITAAVIAAVDNASTRDDLRDAEDRARRDREKALEEFNEVEEYIPEASDYRYEDAEGFLLEDPELAEVYANAQDVASQRAALDRLAGWSTGELDDIDRARQMQSRMEQGQFSRGAREAALAEMQSRGLGGSNAELAAILGGGQAAAQRMALDDAMTRAQAQERALSATSQMGSLSSRMRDQGFSEAATRARAADAWNAENMAYRRDLQRRNVDRQNEATDNAFRYRYNVATGRSNARTGNAAAAMEDAQRQADRDYAAAAGRAQAIAGAGQAIGGAVDAATTESPEERRRREEEERTL